MDSSRNTVSQTIYTDKEVQSSASGFETSRSAPLYGKPKAVKIGFVKIPLFWANSFFAFLFVAGQVGQNVSLPLWIDSTKGNTTGPSLDCYFVLSFSSVMFITMFALGILFHRIFWPEDFAETAERFPHSILFLVGFCDAMNGALIVFASKGSRTPPYLQAILGNFLIPLTIFFRLILLRKKPTLQKLLCGSAVFIGLFVCLIPTIFPTVDPKSEKVKEESFGASRVLWPMVFMLGSIPEALMNIFGEKGIKLENETSNKGIHLLYFLFWTSLYELLTVGLLFWLDILPWYGNVDNMKDFGRNWWFGLQCFFGGAGCDASSGARGTMYVLMHIVNHIGGTNLLRHSEGATWLAIVMSLVTPLGFLFWTLFSEVPFQFHPEGHMGTWFSLGGLVVMVPAIFIYNTGPPEISLNPEESGRQELQFSVSFSRCNSDPGPEEPLLSNKTNWSSYTL